MLICYWAPGLDSEGVLWDFAVPSLTATVPHSTWSEGSLREIGLASHTVPSCHESVSQLRPAAPPMPGGGSFYNRAGYESTHV